MLVSVGMVAALAFASMGQFNAVRQWYVAGRCWAWRRVRVPAAGTRHDRQLVQEEGGPCDGHRQACSGIGGAVMNPLGGALIQSLGWRPTMRCSP
ncbi:MAG: hypothetical protein ACLSVD_18025 [Eggerthellaceae bacterium]